MTASKSITAASQITRSRLENLVETILDTIVDGVITINQHGQIQSFNKACVKLFGYTADDVLGKNVHMLMPEPYRSAHDGYLDNYRKSGDAKIIGIGREVAAKRKDGSVFPIDLAVGEMHAGGQHAFVGIIRDISERREAETAREQLRQAQKMEALGQLTGGIAHDFNNLLAIILGNLDLMAERIDANHPLHEFISPSIDAAEHGANLTKQLLAFGRKQALQPKVISVNEMLHYFGTMARHTLGERIETIMALDENAWHVLVDPSQLQNALINLSINARDAMPEGGKLIFETQNIELDTDYTSQQPDVKPGDYVMIAVSDTGSGMDPQTIEKAFEPFFTTKAVGRGSGLGLSMVYGFVKQSAGHIKLYSEPGHGTSVKIYLPRAEGALSEVDVYHGPTRSVHREEKRILVVEDNINVLKLTSNMVVDLGYHVLTAENGDIAMKILESRDDIDMLLTDVMLPGTLNGPELARLAVQRYPMLKVLFNSGYAEHAMKQSGMLDEGVHLISKPFRKGQLAGKIIEVLNS